MKKLTSSIERWLSSRFPELFLKWVQQPRNLFRFRTERELNRGKPLSKSSHPSILFFTTQKCASRYVDSVLDRLASSAGLVHADYDAYVTMVKMPAQQGPFAGEAAMRRAFRPQGYYYGPIGTYRPIPDMDKYRVVLQLRDPRDVLTSLYYSTAFSHATINPKLLRRRKEALTMDVDSFVLHEIEEYMPIFSQYRESLIGRKPVLLLRYEDMVSDFPRWLDRLSRHIDLANFPKTLEAIRKDANFSVAEENKFAQRRQITPGDYLRKLRPETIAQLNDSFKSVIKTLGYSF